MQAPLANSRLSFGLYEVDLQTGEMWKAGYRIKLQSQPFKVLTVLLEQPGQIVSREELQLRLWGKDTVVDFDHSLGTAINKIREALGDSAENPHFIETLSRRGYRFLAPVTYLAKEPKAPIWASPKTTSNNAEMIDGFDPQTQGYEISAHSKATAPSGRLATARSAAEGGGRLIWMLPAIAICVALIAGYFAGLSRSPVTPAHIRQITS